MSPSKPEKKDRDPFEVMRNIAYRMSQPTGRQDNPTLTDFVNFAKFQICEARGKLFYDKIWDDYSEEQILTEYFAIRFTKDEEFRLQWESENGTPVESDVEWMFKEIEKNKQEMGAAASKALGEKTESDEGFDETLDSLVKE